MIAVDTNVLVLAHRASLERHAAARAWLAALSEGSAPWGLPVFCLGEFVRVVTHPRIFSRPSTVQEALAVLEGLLASPSSRLLVPGTRFPEIFSALVRSADARGNLAFDAQIAAVCLEQNVTKLLTEDRDFSRFAELSLLQVGDAPPGRSSRG